MGNNLSRRLDVLDLGDDILKIVVHIFDRAEKHM